MDIYKLIKCFIFFWVIFFTSCVYNIEEELYPDTGCSTASMSYRTDINPIISSNCLGCHNRQSNNGNVNLEGYVNLLKFVNNNRLLGAIKHNEGFAPMPQSAPKLLDCEIDKIEQWIDQGALDN